MTDVTTCGVDDTTRRELFYQLLHMASHNQWEHLGSRRITGGRAGITMAEHQMLTKANILWVTQVLQGW